MSVQVCSIKNVKKCQKSFDIISGYPKNKRTGFIAPYTYSKTLTSNTQSIQHSGPVSIDPMGCTPPSSSHQILETAPCSSGQSQQAVLSFSQNIAGDFQSLSQEAPGFSQQESHTPNIAEPSSTPSSTQLQQQAGSSHLNNNNADPYSVAKVSEPPQLPPSQTRDQNELPSQMRDKQGRFVPNNVPDKPKGERSLEQKQNDQISSKVTKWKAAAVRNMEKIQEVWPEASQLYTCERNKYKGSRNVVEFSSEGKHPDAHLQINTQGHPSNTSLGDDPVQLGEFHGEANLGSTGPGSSVRRLSDCICYICKTRLGSDTFQRIGMLSLKGNIFTILFFLVCTKKDCFKAPAHLACLNLQIPSSYLPRVRCWYFCPFHRAQTQAFESGNEEDLETDGLELAAHSDVSNTPRVDANRGTLNIPTCAGYSKHIL